MSKDAFYGWKLIAVLFVLDFLNMGLPLFGGAVINTYMLKQIPMDHSIYGLGFTLLNLFVGMSSVIVAASILKWNAKTSFIIGSALTSLGALWLSFFVSKPWHYLAGFGVVIATGISFSTIIPITTVVARWFKRYRGKAMAIPLSASGVAGFAGVPFINWILSKNGGDWRQAWMVMAGIALISALIALLLVKERPDDLGQIVDGIPVEVASNVNFVSSTPGVEHNWLPGEAYRTRSYWMILIAGIACQFPYFFFVAHWLLHLREARIDASIAAWAMGFFTMGGILGRLIGGAFMDKITSRFAFMMGLCCYFAGSILAIEVHGNSMPVVFSAGIFYGMGFGWTFVCLNAITAHYYGAAIFPKLNGMMLLLSGIACSPAGFIGGKIFDLFGSYTIAFELNIVLAAIGIFSLTFAAPPQFPGLAGNMPNPDSLK